MLFFSVGADKFLFSIANLFLVFLFYRACETFFLFHFLSTE